MMKNISFIIKKEFLFSGLKLCNFLYKVYILSFTYDSVLFDVNFVVENERKRCPNVQN